MTPGDPLPPPSRPIDPPFSVGEVREVVENIHPGGDFSLRFTARPRMGGRRAVGRQRRGGPRRDRPLMESRSRSPPKGEGGDEIGFSRDMCVCICKKVVCVSLDLTCFCWEVFWGWTFFGELSSFGFFLFRSSLCA